MSREIIRQTLQELGIEAENPGCYDGQWFGSGELIESVSPIDGQTIAAVRCAGDGDYERTAAAATEGFERWRTVPAPKRGEVIRQIGDALREHKDALGRLVTIEMGKILAEGGGEVQEMIDICDFAVGLSRQLYGLSMHSERPGHRMYEQWHPLGPIGVITAFNFPVAVWSWNTAIAAVCGDSVIWKPSNKTPLTANAVSRIAQRVLDAHGLSGVMCLCTGDRKAVGGPMVEDTRLPLISATGSTAMGKTIGPIIAKRLGRTILELGGNNGVLVTEGANLDLVARAVLFGAVGTAGQRCTSTRRLLVQKSVAGEITQRLVKAYEQVPIGDPLDAATLMGPLIDGSAVRDYNAAIEAAKSQGGEVLCGGEAVSGMPSENYVKPTIIRARGDMAIVQEETFAPILYVIEGETVEDLIRTHNDVPQGLSSAMFTQDLGFAERFLSCGGSDCGIANINIGTSGAEIGGAFGGEKETGGGREAGSDSWKAYMRRQTVTINWSGELPLAQGISFGD